MSGWLRAADVEKRDTEIKVLLDCSSVEVERIRTFLADVLEIGGHLVTRSG